MMADKYNALIVVMKDDIAENDTDNITNAILTMKGVLSVERNVSDVDARVAQRRIKIEIMRKLFKIVDKI